LPVGYDVNTKRWYDTAASGVRHFPDRADEAIDWKERPYTFNTSCYSCHVSQLVTNYDPNTDAYHTVWAEPGINCETCHGPGEGHVRACKQVPSGERPKDLKIISTKAFTVEQTNAMCAPCHAKMIALTTAFTPGDRYFDHYDLMTLEHIDFYPDGRDLGENYTYTLWRMSPCVKSGKLDCMHCHTSSGRYRFSGDSANQACLPCHEEQVRDSAAHSHHKPDGKGNLCVACHMPMTGFARMRRSDHSMRAPMPAATIRYKSPNACNKCHDDKDAAWADQWVHKWYSRDYQAPVMAWADLIAAARRQDWTRLSEMLACVTRKDRDEIVANSLVRLLRACPDERKWPVLIKATKDPSPLIRGSAAEELGDHLTPPSVQALLAGTRDDYRLVRIRAASALAGLPAGGLKPDVRRDLDRAVAEFETSMKSRPDDPPSHYNLGNFYLGRREPARAIAEFEKALKLQPNFILPLVNASLAYNAMGRNAEAETNLRRALRIDPNSVAANLNLGLLLGEMGRLPEAATAFRVVLKNDPNSPVAAYNLAVAVGEEHPDQAVQLCRKARDLRPDEPKYGYSLAIYLRQSGDIDGAEEAARDVIRRSPAYVDAYLLLGDIYEKQGKADEAIELYREAVGNEALSQPQRRHFAARLQALSSR
jgi:tetratricopeptide (TPR) repeat protein